MITISDIMLLDKAFEEGQLHGNWKPSYEAGKRTGVRLEISLKKTEEIEKFVRAITE